MSSKQELEKRLANLKDELDHVEGTQTEVYSRIVGYYRSVRNWNAGKREEYGQRRAFAMPAAAFSSPAVDKATQTAKAASVPGAIERGAVDARRSGILVFTKKACPNCPPVKDYIVRAGLPAVFVDVDGEDGLALARRHGVLATPTVVGLDGEGRESFRAYGLTELKERLPGLELGAC